METLHGITHHLENSPLATICWDREFRVAFWSQRAESMFGWTAAEVMGKTPLDWQFVFEADREQVNQTIAQLFSGINTVCHNRNYRKDGSVVFCEWYNSTLLDDQGNLVSMLSFALDVTDRKQAEVALKESENRFQRIAASSPGAIYIYGCRPDDSLYFEYISQAITDMLEVTPEQVLADASVLESGTHPDDVPGYLEALNHSRETLQPFYYEWRNFTPSGKLKWLQAQSRPERRTNGDTVWYGVVLDITDRKVAELSLQRYERIVSATTDGISLVDRQYHYQIVNQAYLNWFNKSYTDIVGHSVRELLGQEVFETVIQPRLDRCLAGETVQYNEWFEFPVLGWQFLSVTYSPYREADQTISGVVVSLRNITSLKQAEEAVRQSEQRMRLLTDALPVFVSYSDTEQRYQFVNKAYERHFGMSREEICGQRSRDIIGEVNYGRVQGYIERALAGEQVSYDVTVPRPQMGDRYLSVTLVPDLDSQEQVRGYYALIIDISDRKRLEQELIQSRDFRELLFNESGDALFLVDFDTLLTTDCNQRAVELFEVGSKAELIHIEGHIFQKRQFTPEEMATIQQDINEKGYWSREVEYITRKGREFWGDLSVKQLIFGEQRFNLVRVNDISKRKAAEFALQQSEARYLAILEDQTELITRFRADGTLLFVNDAFCRYYGVSRDEVIGYHYQPLIYPEDQPAINHCLAALSPENPVGSVQHRVFVNGTVRWMQWTNRAIYDSQGNLLELQSVGRDIDDRKQAEQQVQAALAEKEVLLQEVYHRVKNNLQLIQSMLQMQQRRLNNPEAIQALQDSWNRIMTISLVHEILYQSDNLAQIDLRDYIPALVQHIAASYHLTAPDVVVKTDVESIVAPMKKAICCGLILNELVTNALKYAFPGKKSGQITVKVTVDRTQSEKAITMTVQDNGIGLPQLIDLSRIKTLGLTLVQDFVDQLRGTISVESSQGCLFRITFSLES